MRDTDQGTSFWFMVVSKSWSGIHFPTFVMLEGCPRPKVRRNSFLPAIRPSIYTLFFASLPSTSYKEEEAHIDMSSFYSKVAYSDRRKLEQGLNVGTIRIHRSWWWSIIVSIFHWEICSTQHHKIAVLISSFLRYHSYWPSVLRTFPTKWKERVELPVPILIKQNWLSLLRQDRVSVFLRL